MIDFDRLPASPADQVIVVVFGDLVNQLPRADVGSQDKILLGQEDQRPVDGGFREAGHHLAGALENFGWREVFSRLAKDVQDRQALRCQAKALSPQAGNGRFDIIHCCVFYLLRVVAIVGSIIE